MKKIIAVSKKSIRKAEHFMDELIPKRMNSMLNTNIELIIYKSKYEGIKFDISQLKYWLSEIIKFSNGEKTDTPVSGSSYEYTLLSYIHLASILDIDEFSDWMSKTLRELFIDFYLRNEGPRILFYLRNNVISNDITFRTLVKDSISTIDSYSSTMEISDFIISVAACGLFDMYKKELLYAKKELLSRQNENGSWYNWTIATRENDKESLSEGNLFVTTYVIHALSLIDKKRRHSLIKTRNWIISQQHKEGNWESPNGTDVGLFTSLSITAIKLIDKNISNFLKESKGSFMDSSKRKKYDVFISHASKDKITYVENLVQVIKTLGISIFYDTDTFSWGDNWKELIINGTKDSEFAIIIISENFFGREWTERELNDFLSLQNESGQKIILPLLHDISIMDLTKKYPALSALQAIKTSEKNEEEVSLLLAKELIKRYR